MSHPFLFWLLFTFAAGVTLRHVLKEFDHGLARYLARVFQFGEPTWLRWMLLPAALMGAMLPVLVGLALGRPWEGLAATGVAIITDAAMTHMGGTRFFHREVPALDDWVIQLVVGGACIVVASLELGHHFPLVSLWGTVGFAPFYPLAAAVSGLANAYRRGRTPMALGPR